MSSRIAALALAVIATHAASLGAQGHKPQVAGIAPAPTAAPNDNGAYPRRGHHAPYSHGAVPVFVANDGQIYADFGYGYEPVVRSCANSGNLGYAPAAQSPAYAAPAYAAPTYTPPTYTAPTYTPPNYGQTTFSPRNTQPAPAQATQAERDLAATRTAQVAPQPQNQRAGALSCWRADEQGRVIVVRP